MADDVKKGEWLSEGESHVVLLRGLLSYHQRMAIPINANKECFCGDVKPCPAISFLDIYQTTLEEAVRCIKIVHKIEDNKEVI